MCQHPVSIFKLAGMFFSMIAICLAQSEQTHSSAISPYTFRTSVDEVSLIFHASDAQGTPLTHLTRSDLVLSDNGKQQNQILALDPLQDRPIRAGFLFDVSRSMFKDINFNRSVIQMYASRLLRKDVDQAFVMQFDTDTRITQNWTGNERDIAAGAAAIGEQSGRIDPLTAIFDSLYTTCRDQWLHHQTESTGNFILLFSDGIDDASHVYLSEAVDMCQRAHVAIYAIASSRGSGFSDGYETLNNLAHQTGGRVFIHPKGHEVLEDLEIMEAEQRYQYLLVYKPSMLIADGSFHRIRLQCSVRGARIATRSGYYAFVRR